MGVAPTRPGMPLRHSSPPHPWATARSTKGSHGSPAAAVTSTVPPLSREDTPRRATFTTSPSTPASATTTLDPPPRIRIGTPRDAAQPTAVAMVASSEASMKKRAEPPTPMVQRGASGTFSRGRKVADTRAAPAGLLHAQAGIEQVAEPIAQEVQAEARQGEGHPGEEADPERLADHVLAARDDIAPGRHIRRHAHAQEAQDGLGENRVGEDEAALDEERADTVGEDVTQRDRRIFASQGARSLDVVELADRQHGAPDEHGRARHVDDREREDHVPHPGSAHRHESNGEQDGGEGHSPSITRITTVSS